MIETPTVSGVERRSNFFDFLVVTLDITTKA